MSKTCQECGGIFHCKNRCKNCYDSYLKTINPEYKKAQSLNRKEWAKKIGDT